MLQKLLYFTQQEEGQKWVQEQEYGMVEVYIAWALPWANFKINKKYFYYERTVVIVIGST